MINERWAKAAAYVGRDEMLFNRIDTSTLLCIPCGATRNSIVMYFDRDGGIK